MDKELEGRLMAIEVAIIVILQAIEPVPEYGVKMLLKKARSKLVDLAEKYPELADEALSWFDHRFC